MNEIVPRWEWRTFGTVFGRAERVLADLPVERIHDSDEIYLLVPGGANVKIRDDMLDIKVLRSVGASGLELWTPVMKAAAPFSRQVLMNAFDALGHDLPPLDREHYTIEDFRNELVEPVAEIRQVEVHKHRVRYRIEGCTGELTDVRANGGKVRTIAVESEKPEAVVAAVHRLGLDGFLNTDYARGLTALLEGRPERYAVIDVGTNSVKFHVGERRDDGSWSRIVDRAEVTRLGEGLDGASAIAPTALKRTADAIDGMVEDAKREGARAIAAVGTAGLRIADNSAEVIAEISEKTGVTIEVISGEEETRLAFLAARAGLGLEEGRLVVFDTGGGSSQFTFGQGDRIAERFSVDVGAVRYTERFGLGKAVSTAVLAKARSAISGDLAALDGRPPPDVLIGMGGAVTNITAVSRRMVTYDPDVVQGAVLTYDEIERQIELYRITDAAGRRGIAGLQPKRADVILAGACIVRSVMEKLGQQRLTVSDRGLRHGVLAERFSFDRQ
jgi:exopolyphosphatase/guanosine-5'-triphosphate,3'-diphosphate pyrophosphatase